MQSYNHELKDEIKKCYDVNGNLSFKKISKKILDEIITNTSFLDEYCPKPQERVYCIMNDITSIPRCPLTNKKLRFSPQVKQYSNSKECMYSLRTIKNPFDFKNKNKKTLEIINKCFINNDYNLLSKEECVILYRWLTPNKNSRIDANIALKNIDMTCSLYYYTPFIATSKLDIAERFYCVLNNITTYPVDDNGNKLEFLNTIVGYSKHSSKKNMYDFLLNRAKEQISNDYFINDIIKNEHIGTTNRIDVTCKKCNYNFTPFFKNGLWKQIYCPGCNGIVGRSRPEEHICDFLSELGVINIVKNTRSIISPYELDIYLPDYNLAIEYCGILWHSFGTDYPNNAHMENAQKYKHLEKYTYCKERNIKLLTIFENEWMNKREIVKSIIKNKLGKTKTRIYARKCHYGQVDKKMADKFLEDNHIQGKCNYSDSYGLFFNNELVSLACFGKRKITRGDVNYELIRFCNKLDTTVVGGASKIIKNFNPDNFISYCDLRYGDGGLYYNLNMTLIKTSKPNYFYTRDRMILLHRSNFQKHKISNDKNSNKTEWQIMYESGYRRIYDCGNLVFAYKKE